MAVKSASPKEAGDTLDMGSISSPVPSRIMIKKPRAMICTLESFAFFLVPEMGPGRGIYYGVWHSISAFCNAGFDLMGPCNGPYSSFTARWWS